MSGRVICPICGSENPEGSVVCQVCKVNLQNLPDDILLPDTTPVENLITPENDPETNENEDLDPSSPVPMWLQKRFQQNDKKEFDINSYTDVIFGVPDSRKPASGTKQPKPRKTRKKEPVYQPQLGDLVESPLVEPDPGTEQAEPKNFPTLTDFKTIRPVKKWDDPQTDESVNTLKQQANRVFETSAVQMPLWWQQDAPLVETDDEETGKAADDDSAYFNSVSPTKVMDPETDSEDDIRTVFGNSDVQQGGSGASVISDDYQPESGTLISDLMNDMNSSSVTLTPQENNARNNGTVFYSGNHGGNTEEPPAPIDISVPEEETLSSAAALDQILRGMGYQTEGEVPEAAAFSAADGAPAEEKPQQDDPGFINEGDQTDPLSGSGGDSIPDTKIPEKTDLLDELDIPWDLFGSQDMALPQSPEESALKTFSRSGIPSDQESSTYQQRMMSSILEKIIFAENFVPAKKKPNERAVSAAARLFWSLLALGGIVLILMTGLTDRIKLPASSDTAEAEAFYQYADSADGNALFVLDYTPAFSAELDAAAEELLNTLEENADRVYLSTLNPAAMPKAQELLSKHEGKVEFAGWWPAGLISIRSHLSSGTLPEQVWLVTSDSGSVRSWAEQIAASGGPEKLYVLASGQLEPIIRTYLEAGLVTGAMSRDTDLQRYGAENTDPVRNRMAVLYLTALLPLAWLGGIVSKFLKSDPNYGRKSTRKEDKAQTDQDKEAAFDRGL